MSDNFGNMGLQYKFEWDQGRSWEIKNASGEGGRIKMTDEQIKWVIYPILSFSNAIINWGSSILDFTGRRSFLFSSQS